MEKIKELKNRVYALYDIVDFLINLGNYEYADDISDEIKEIEKLIEEVEKNLKGV